MRCATFAMKRSASWAALARMRTGPECCVKAMPADGTGPPAGRGGIPLPSADRPECAQALRARRLSARARGSSAGIPASAEAARRGPVGARDRPPSGAVSAGYRNSSLRLLARQVVELGISDSISHETEGHKVPCQVIPDEADADFTASMSEVLETYERPCDPAQPVECMDAQPAQLIKETCEPLAGCNHPRAAHEVAALLEGRYAACERITWCLTISTRRRKERSTPRSRHHGHAI